MINQFYHFFSSIPNFKGKLAISEKIFSAFKGNINQIQISQMQPGHKMSLFLPDRIQRRMFIKKNHEPETEIHLINFLKQSKCFLDIGANVGYFTLLAKSVNPQIKVYAFEPNPNNVKKIKENVELNHFTNIVITSDCLSNSLGEVSFSVPPVNESGWGRITNDHLPLENFIHIKAKSITLDSLIENNFFKNDIPDLIKIDVEGNEFKILQGAKLFFEKFSPILCIELNEPCLQDCQTSSVEIINFMRQLSYKCSAISSNNQLIEVEAADKNYRYLNYFFIKQK